MGRSRRESIAVVPDADSVTTTLAPVDSLLWEERVLLQRLLYQLTAQELVIAAGRVEWLRDSDVEIRALVHDLGLHELGRAAQTDALAVRYGLPPNSPLRRLVSVVPEPWRSIMADHLYALRQLQDAIERTADANVALLRAARAPESAPAGSHSGAS